MLEPSLTTAEIKTALGVATIEQVDRWTAKWGLKPYSPRGKRPRLYRRSEFLDAYRRAALAETTRL